MPLSDNVVSWGGGGGGLPLLVMCLLFHTDWFKIKEGSLQVTIEVSSQNSISCL